MKKEYKNMMFHKHRPEHMYYQNVNIGVNLDPPLVEKYLRRLAAGGSHDAMKVFMAKALVQCMATLSAYGDTVCLNGVKVLAGEVDLEFTDAKEEEEIVVQLQTGTGEVLETGSIDQQSESRTGTGGAK